MRTVTRFAVVGLLPAIMALMPTAAHALTDASPSRQDHTYTIPVGAITDLGDLTKVANLGKDFASLLGH